MTLERVLSEIRDLEAAPFTDKNVYDLAMLYIVRDHMQTPDTAPATVLSPTVQRLSPLDQVEAAMAEICVTSSTDRRRLQEIREAARIVGGE